MMLQTDLTALIQKRTVLSRTAGTICGYHIISEYYKYEHGIHPGMYIEADFYTVHTIGTLLSSTGLVQAL